MQLNMYDNTSYDDYLEISVASQNNSDLNAPLCNLYVLSHFEENINTPTTIFGEQNSTIPFENFCNIGQNITVTSVVA